MNALPRSLRSIAKRLTGIFSVGEFFVSLAAEALPEAEAVLFPALTVASPPQALKSGMAARAKAQRTEALNAELRSAVESRRTNEVGSGSL